MRFSLLLSFALVLGACSTAEEAVDESTDAAATAADAVDTGVDRGSATAEDAAGTAADATADAAMTAGDAADTAADATYNTVTDAAGTAYRSVRGLFTGSGDASTTTAGALVRPTNARGSQAQGTVRFMPMGDDMRVMVSLSGLQPGMHGVHIHQYGECGPADVNDDGMMEPGGAAGSHWDPLDTNNHGAATEGLMQKHLGDLGNVRAGADGTAETTFTIEAFPSEYSIAGRGLIVHAMRDNLEEDPGGGSGTRMGCGVIEARM